jgi:hypothetical protein
VATSTKRDNGPSNRIDRATLFDVEVDRQVSESFVERLREVGVSDEDIDDMRGHRPRRRKRFWGKGLRRRAA